MRKSTFALEMFIAKSSVFVDIQPFAVSINNKRALYNVNDDKGRSLMYCHHENKPIQIYIESFITKN